MIKTVVVSAVVLLNQPAMSVSPSITPEMRAAAEKAIKLCEEKYNDIKAMRIVFDQVKKPGPFAPLREKAIYKNLDINKKAFDIQFGEFANFTNDKIKIRIANTPQDLQEAVAAYSSNCKRFSDGLNEFVLWATKGKESPGYEVIFKDWQADARKQMRK